MGLFNWFHHRTKNSLDIQSNRYGVDLVAYDYPKSIVSEQFRTIRTNLSFSNAKSIMFTSDVPSEGKSTVAANLAITWANEGKRVCIMDCDMRRSTVHKTFNLNNQNGLSTFLSSKTDLNHTVQVTKIANLYAVPAGPVPPNPSELVANQRLNDLINILVANFDLVILDCPPVNSISDASIIAAKVDGVIVVVPQDIAIKASVKAEVDQLKKVHAHILGVVMNHVVRHESNGYYYYYNYKS